MRNGPMMRQLLVMICLPHMVGWPFRSVAGLFSTAWKGRPAIHLRVTLPRIAKVREFRCTVVVLTLFVAGPAAGADGEFERTIEPVLRQYCVRCHSTELKEGELDLEQFANSQMAAGQPKIWEQVLAQMADGEMPPKDEPQLPSQLKAKLTTSLQAMLNHLALANAGDPGDVVLRRLSNMEYTYTLRDLTGVASLDPLREFPVDGAAGEGFTNAGAALVMSPALLAKYLDAAKDMAAHAVLTPDGIHFSPSTSAFDWTDEALAKIRELYARYGSQGSQSHTTLQGIKLDIGTSSGRLPLADYLAALQSGSDHSDKPASKPDADGQPEQALKGRHRSPAGLSPKYLATLKRALTDTRPSVLLDPLREKFREGKLSVADIETWQQALWRFTSVGHIGKQNGPKAWQESVTPLADQHEMRVKLTAPADGGDVVLYLCISDAGDGNEHDKAVWSNARLVMPGRMDLSLSALPALVKQMEQRRDTLIVSTERCLAAVADADTSQQRTDVAALATKHKVDAELLANWLAYLGVGSAGDVPLAPLLVNKMETPDYSFIKGWAGENALSVLANSSDQTVATPGTMKPHSVATHPSPELASVVAWRSPVAASVSVRGSVQDAHTACGNGVTWALQLRRGHTHEVLASGSTEAAKVFDLGEHENLRVQPGDVIAIIVGPRDGDHICDLTAIDLTISDGTQEWDLAKDVSPDILAGNPHADRLGNKDVWHFFSQPEKNEPAAKIPTGSVLARWRNTIDNQERASLAEQVWQDAALRAQLLAFNGPLLGSTLKAIRPSATGNTDMPATAPSVTEVRIPASLADGAELIATGKLADDDGSVQMRVLSTKPEKLSGLAASKTETAQVNGQWSDNNHRTLHGAPVIVADGSPARQRFETAFKDFRALFPIALCYTKIVPVDEVVTLTLLHREDDHLKRLMLDEAQAMELDRLWDELRFVSESPLKQVNAFEQLWQFATQDATPEAFEPMREPIMRDAEEFKKLLIDVEPKHVQAVLDFAQRAWRRSLTRVEQSELRTLYQSLRKQDLPHASAVRMLLARVLVAPAFLYRGEKSASGPKAAPVSDNELATRLSYFLWSSAPDEELRTAAASGKLHTDEVLIAQTHRMLQDDRVRRLATEFGCQWLHIRDLETLNEKSERHFPTFVGLRDEMQEEAVLFLMDMFQADRSVLSLLDADHSFMNATLAGHYGIDLPVIKLPDDGLPDDGLPDDGLPDEDWQRVDGLRARGRGGILGFAATLAKHSGASRTSPILRGNWISEVVLGEKLPRPPKDVPILPEVAPEGLTERQLIERHSSDPKCARCHKRIDHFGFALEGFDAIGRARSEDAAGLPIDTLAKLPGGGELNGMQGLRSYLLEQRRDDFLRQFCRKLLGYALGRGVQLSDKPLLDDMLVQLKSHDHRVSTAIELIILSPQFREIRGQESI